MFHFRKKKLPYVEGQPLPSRRRLRAGRVERSSGAGLVFDILIVVVLVLVMFICLIPFWHTLMASLSDGQLLTAHNGMLWWFETADGAPNFGGYAKTLTYNNFAIIKSYGITIAYLIYNVLLGFIVNVIGGYVLCRKTKLGKALTIFIMITMLFNGGVIPTYMVVRGLGLLNNPLSLVLPSCTNAMFVVLGMNAFKSVPESTIESAKLDGAGHFRLMFRIMLPQAMGLFIVSMINTAIISWNAWFEASIYITSQRDLWPLQIWIKQLTADMGDFAMQTNPDWNSYIVSYCVVIVSMIPILIAMPFVQKQLQKGSLAGAVKE